MITELEAANNLLEAICAKLREYGLDCEDPIEILDAIDQLKENIEAMRDATGLNDHKRKGD